MRIRIWAATFAFAMAVSQSGGANVYTFFTPGGATLDGKPVSASATFTTATNQILVTLANLQANPISVIQAISDVLFTVSGSPLGGGTGLYTPAANYVQIAKDGSSAAGACCAIWGLGYEGSNTYHLNALVGKGAGGTGPGYLIVGPGPYSNANGSIAGSKPHNPFIDQTATFTLAIAGVTAESVISNVFISFGTESGREVPAIPIPGALWLFACGLTALAAIGRRKARAVAGS